MKFPKLSFRKKSTEDSLTARSDVADGPTLSSGGSTSGGKQWVFSHIEKVVVVVAIGILGVLIYSAFGKLSLKQGQNPDELLKRAEGMETMIDQSAWNGSEERIPDFAALVEKANQPIEQGAYSFEAIAGVEARKFRKRTRPHFFPAEKLWVKGGSGIFWIRGPQGEEVKKEERGDREGGREKQNKKTGFLLGVPAPENAMAELKYWAVITAILPLKKQHADYERHFRDAEGYDPDSDIPQYAIARIQRLEVSKDSAGTAPDWEKPDLQWEWHRKLTTNADIQDEDTAFGRTVEIKKSDHWAAEAAELVDSQYVHDELTTPLGPLGYKSWRQWATHPDIPLAIKRVAEDTENPAAKKRFPNNPKLANQGPLNTGRKNKKGLFGGFFDAGPGPQQGSTGDTGSTKKSDNKTETQSLISQNKLVRLFDFSVEPGKTYLYRVQLLLLNPNHEKPARILKNPTDNEHTFTPDIWLPWSAQSQPVHIPSPTAVFAAGVPDPSKKEAVVIVKKPIGQTGELQIGKLNLQQGGSVGGSPNNSLRIDGLSNTLEKGNSPVNTDFTLVDIRPSNVDVAFSDLLLLDSAGRFYLKNTAAGQEETDLFEQLSERTQQKTESPEEEGAAGDDDRNRLQDANPEKPRRRGKGNAPN